MALSAEVRNERIHSLLANLIKEAKKKKDIVYPSPFTEKEVEALFANHIWGHREITLTILLARLLDPTFKASEDFYSCHPRSIYEKPIRSLLRKNNIPHKKSGPLNVAKNSQKIDQIWAHNKRGDGMALVVAGLVKEIESVPPNVLKKFTLAYVQRYLLEGKRVAKLKVVVKPNENPIFLYNLCRDLIINVPDGGATPQVVVGMLLDNFNISNNNGIRVTGHLDSVSTTNTTSKKPGDVVESMPNSSKRIYEITTKSFSSDRMIESYESVKDFDKANKIAEVFVICRPEDLPPNLTKTSSISYLMGVTQHQDIHYYFIDIFGWMQEKLLFTAPEIRKKFYADLVTYINQTGTSEKVKKFFNGWHQQRSS